MPFGYAKGVPVYFIFFLALSHILAIMCLQWVKILKKKLKLKYLKYFKINTTEWVDKKSQHIFAYTGRLYVNNE